MHESNEKQRTATAKAMADRAKYEAAQRKAEAKIAPQDSRRSRTRGQQRPRSACVVSDRFKGNQMTVLSEGTIVRKLLIATVGLPRSGKTTWALAYSKEHGAPIVNPDSVRLAIHGQRFVLSAEQFVWATVNAMIRSLFLAGHEQVILDSTSMTRKRRDVLQFNDCETVFHHIDTAADVCKLRAQAEDDVAIIPVIERMALEFEPLGDDEGRFVPLGATDSFPQGQINEEDEGEIRIAVAADRSDGIVRIHFGKLVSWLGLPPDQAMQLSRSIASKAEALG